jgi:hypothetical protein
MDRNGFIKVPLENPGIGVSVDLDYIEGITVWKETVE